MGKQKRGILDIGARSTPPVLQEVPEFQSLTNAGYLNSPNHRVIKRATGTKGMDKNRLKNKQGTQVSQEELEPTPLELHPGTTLTKTGNVNTPPPHRVIKRATGTKGMNKNRPKVEQGTQVS